MAKLFIGLCVLASAVMVFMSLGSNSQLPNYPTTQTTPIQMTPIERINRSVTSYSKSNPNDRARYEADGGTLWDAPSTVPGLRITGYSTNDVRVPRYGHVVSK